MALDAIARHLVARGARAAFLDFGGSSQLAFGFTDDPPIMVVAGLGPGEVVRSVALSDAALSTSRSPAAGEAGAIVDPRSGRAVVDARVVTVVGPSATLAEVWSTALVVLGRPGIARAIADGVEVMLADEDGVVVSSDFPGGPRSDQQGEDREKRESREESQAHADRQDPCNPPREGSLRSAWVGSCDECPRWDQVMAAGACGWWSRVPEFHS